MRAYILRRIALLVPVLLGISILVFAFTRVLPGDAALTREERLSARERIFAEALERFTAEVQPTFEASTYAGFVDTPLNNATLLARMRYYHRLPDFQALLDDHGGDLGSAIAAIKAGTGEAGDPFEVLGNPR